MAAELADPPVRSWALERGHAVIRGHDKMRDRLAVITAVVPPAPLTREDLKYNIYATGPVKVKS